jgi:hypothetical protein
VLARAVYNYPGHEVSKLKIHTPYILIKSGIARALKQRKINIFATIAALDTCSGLTVESSYGV